jgi:hypothetical protein
MKKTAFTVVALMFATNLFLSAQDSPVEHMQYFTDHEEILSKKYLSYMSEIAHGSKARKMEKRREDVVSSIRETLRETNKLRPFKGDASLRDAYKEYYSVLLSVFTEDYDKIVDMEEVAERSYDAMEAYFLIQEKAEEKLDGAYEKVKLAYEGFAAKNNVRLNEGQASKLNRKLTKVSKVNNYMNMVFLIFFKSSVQETLLIEGVNKKDVNAVEQCKNSLLKFSIEGLSKLDTLKPYEGDGSLINACRKVLEFQRNEAQSKISAYTSFLMKEEDFNKQKKSFESKPASSRTKNDVDSYNSSVNAFNKSMAEYNKANQDLNNARTKVMTHWEITRKRFMDQHVPHKM